MDTLIPIFDFKGRVMLRNTCPEVECPFCKAKVSIFDLETLVEQSITAIELEEKRKRLLKDMPKPGKKQ